MKVLALVDRETYLCEVKHKELEKFLNLYYGKLEALKVGSEVDFGKGHDFHDDAINAMRRTRLLSRRS
jgi:hypothetical protein